jgi:uncharacterized protein (DUF362 family)
MSRQITRRRFVKASAGSAILGATVLSSVAADPPPDLVACQGPDAEQNARAAVEALGGMGRYVKRGQVVALLPNLQGPRPGASTDPGIIRAVASMCRDAGASEIRCLTWLPKELWDRPDVKPFRQALDEGQVRTIFVPTPPPPARSGDPQPPDPPEVAAFWRTLAVPKGIVLKQIRVFNALWECDVFISMPIFKDHIGSRFTGVLKNYMGTSHPIDNRKFHPTFEGAGLEHMEQCIADLNTVVREPDLCVVAAMECLKTNGPFGPGEVVKPRQVVAGKDRVALDVYGAGLLGLEGSKVSMVRRAYDQGLGEIDLAKLKVARLERTS